MTKRRETEPLPARAVGLCEETEGADVAKAVGREEWPTSTTELRATIKQLESQLISGFYEDRVPQFEQGPPHHELQQLVTAEEVTRYVAKIEQLSAALEQLKLPEFNDQSARFDRIEKVQKGGN